MSDTEIKKQNDLFKLYVDNERSDTKVGTAWMTEGAFEGFVHKVLYSTITNNEFYMVLGGHSAAASHGNNFFQDYILLFHHLMEPIFDRLGV